MISSIQGLRGLAVLLVVFAHWGLVFGSGFVGVDVFFVISGYVVTLSVIRGLDKKGYSFFGFLSRRFVRLVPALSVMVLTVVFVQTFFSPGFSWSALSREGLSALFYLSNVEFELRLGDYFADKAGTSFLLHTWSLAVEFQAYVFLGCVFLLLQLGLPRAIKVVAGLLLVACLVSLGFAFVGQSFLVDGIGAALAGYYSPLTRLYEIAVGSLLAIIPQIRIPKYLSSLGLILILSIAILPEGTVPWEFAAFGAVVGSIMIILASDPRNTSFVLESRFLKGVGDISYSIYLWHWPIMVFFTSTFSNQALQLIFGLPLTIAISILSFRFLERPNMKPKVPIQNGNSSSHKFKLARAGFIFLASAVLLSSVSWLWSSYSSENYSSLPGVLKGDISSLGFANSFNSAVMPCPDSSYTVSPEIGNWYSCYTNSTSKDLDFLLIGNSHAAHLLPGISYLYPDLEFRYYSLTAGFSNNNENLEGLRESLSSDEVKAQLLILNSFWRIENTDVSALQSVISTSGVEDGHVIFFEDVPDFKVSPERCKYNELFTIKSPCYESLPEFLNHISFFRDFVSSGFPNAQIVESSEIFRMNSDVYFMADSKSVYFRDQNHLNFEGSIYLFGRLREIGELSSLESLVP